MKAEFLTGFVKQATELGYSDEDIATMWKVAMSQPEGQEIFDALGDFEKDAMSAEELEVLSFVKAAVDKEDEVARLRTILANVCE